ncbi:SdpA family antimicrobial peptide system protein [Leifsonia sp. NPDC056665]|uniref:SdpA family antimicrobial peptide system protein n=1 Tax=Leifsonia sp. NPDC056665 TaxID=3345901 RepID=UPI0036A502BC
MSDLTLPRRRVTIFALALAAFWVLVGGFVYLTNQPENVLTTSWQLAAKTSVQTVMPEQWGFFTRSPREDELLPYRQNAGQWSSASAYPHSQAQYFFGWNRVSRAQGIEIGMLFTEVAGREWRPCSADSSITTCLEASASDAEWTRVANRSPEPTLCGRTAISRALPPPWAWANIGQAKQDVSVIYLDVAC